MADRVRLTVGGRPLWALAEHDGCVQFDFAELCGGTTSVGDLLELADRYRTLALACVPPLQTITPDARRRFGDLVDVLWDRDVRLVVLATGPRSHVLDEADLTDADRMRSRLHLLQAW